MADVAQQLQLERIEMVRLTHSTMTFNRVYGQMSVSVSSHKRSLHIQLQYKPYSPLCCD